MLIDSESLWLAETNTYVLAPGPGGPAVVVDAPPDPEAIARLLAKHELTPVALLLTHGHIDHMGGAGALSRSVGCAAYVHPDDDFLTLEPERQLRMLFGMAPAGDFGPPAERTALVDGQSLDLAGLTIDVVWTPGHTPGHCCFFIADQGALFSGDQLFAGSIGRTDLPGGDLRSLLASMRDKVLTLPDDVAVHPGHGPRTTVGRERRTNPFLQDLI
jgi:glyoxylase-like metal-dependent hydrolase (beta-lactamase superfamily II)